MRANQKHGDKNRRVHSSHLRQKNFNTIGNNKEKHSSQEKSPLQTQEFSLLESNPKLIVKSIYPNY